MVWPNPRMDGSGDGNDDGAILSWDGYAGAEGKEAGMGNTQDSPHISPPWHRDCAIPANTQNTSQVTVPRMKLRHPLSR